MNKEIDLEKIKLLAEGFIEASNEANEFKRLLKEELENVDVEIKENLKNGSIHWYIEEEKEKADKKLVLSYLYNTIIKYNSNSEKFPIPSNNKIEEEIKNQCIVMIEPKWVLKIKKAKNNE